jgi:TolB-like protein/Tfp pilus assembly protein PilF
MRQGFVTRFSDVQVLSFGPFVLDLTSGVLQKAGKRIKLRPQAFEVLALLARNHGRLVHREEIRQAIWNADTFVHFDNGINFCMQQIRAALSEDPKRARYIETVPRRGYRFITFVQAGRSKERYYTEGCNCSLAVMPFHNLGETTEQESFADGMTEVLTNELVKLGLAKIVSRTTVMQYKRTCKSVVQIAKELEVQALVTGTVLQAGQRIRVTSELVDAGTSHVLWAESYEREPGDIVTLQREIGSAIANEIGLKLRPGMEKSDLHRENSDAYLSYVEGRYWLSKRTLTGSKEAIRCFERAIQCEPRFPLAFAGLADCYSILGYSGLLSPNEARLRAIGAATQALELDETLAEAHASLAYARMIFDWAWEAAKQGFMKAIFLKPNHAPSHQWYAAYLTATCQHQEAIAEIHRAWELDPLSLAIGTDVGWSHCHAGDYDVAIKHYLNVLEMEPDFLPARWGLGLSYVKKSMFSHAIVELQKAVSLSPNAATMVSTLGHAYAVSGEISRAEKLLEKLKSQSTRTYVPSYDMATVCLGLGNRDEAFEFLQKAFIGHETYLVYMRADPRLECGRSDPRLRVLQHRVGLPLSA